MTPTPNTPASAGKSDLCHAQALRFIGEEAFSSKPRLVLLEEHMRQLVERDRAERDAELRAVGDKVIKFTTATHEMSMRALDSRDADIASLKQKLAEREAELAELKTRLQDCETTLGLNMLEKEKLKDGLKFVHEISYEKCRIGEDDGNHASIEAIARGCLGLKADDGFENIPNLQAKLAEQSAALDSSRATLKECLNHLEGRAAWPHVTVLAEHCKQALAQIEALAGKGKS